LYLEYVSHMAALLADERRIGLLVRCEEKHAVRNFFKTSVLTL